MMSERIYTEKTSERVSDDEQVPADIPTQPTTEIKTDDIDAVLDEIDGVLESNAEEFVRGFVQKGGQ
ncbi:MAG: ubiquitin-like protein Pup [Candidatus Saccharimonadales bacterium]